MTDIIYRKYQAGDEPRILELHQKVFSADYSMDHWKGQFIENPSPSAQVWLALAQGQCVGHYALMPMSLYIDQEVDVFQSLISMIHSDYQRQGILKSLEAASRSNFDGDYPMYTFLNHNSYDVYTRRFGWEYMGDVGIYVRIVNSRLFGERHPLLSILNPFCMLYHKYYGGFGCRVHFVEFKNFDGDIEQLWLRNRQHMGVTFNRSEPWFEWRFNKSPIEYKKYKILDEGRTVGYIVLRYQSRFGFRFGWILDILVDVDGNNLLFTRTLQALAVKCAQNCDVLSLLLPNETFRKPLRKAGFIRLPRRVLPHPFYFCVKRNGYADNRFRNIAKWYLSWCLHDAL